jgi:SAM-dependent methyltransferase
MPNTRTRRGAARGARLHAERSTRERTLRPDFYREYLEAEERHWWFAGRRRILLSMLESVMPAVSGGSRRLLDVGCGSGFLLRDFRRYGRAFGVDANEEAIRACRARGLDVEHVTSSPLPFERESFDVITALDVLEHLEDDVGTIDDLYRLLKPGGVLLVTVPAFMFLWGTHDEVNEHKRRYTARQLTGRLVKSGFQPSRTTYFNTLLFPPIAAVRLVRRFRRSRTRRASDLGVTPRGVVDIVLARVFAFEAVLLRHVDLPFGVSVLATATKDSPAVRVGR